MIIFNELQSLGAKPPAVESKLPFLIRKEVSINPIGRKIDLDINTSPMHIYWITLLAINGKPRGSGGVGSSCNTTELLGCIPHTSTILVFRLPEMLLGFVFFFTRRVSLCQTIGLLSILCIIEWSICPKSYYIRAQIQDAQQEKSEHTHNLRIIFDNVKCFLMIF